MKQAEMTQMHCIKCGAPLEWNTLRCPQCSTMVRVPLPYRKEARDRARETEKKMMRRAPDSSVDALGYEAMFENGTCRISEGRYSCTLEFDDTNFQAARETEQENIFNQYTSLLNSFEGCVDIKISLLSHTIDEKTWRRNMYMPYSEGDEVGNVFRREINDIIDSRINETRQNVARSRYMTLTVDAPTRSKAEPLLAHACEAALRHFRSMEVSARKLSGVERLRVINAITHPREVEDAISYDDLKTMPGLGTVDLVAPPDFTRDAVPSSACSWGDCNGRVLYLQKYANSVPPSIVSNLSELPINQMITIDMICWDQEVAVETLEQNLTDFKMQKSNYVKKHSQHIYITDEMLPTGIKDGLENSELALGDLKDREQKYWKSSITVLTWADDESELASNVEEIKTIMRGANMRMEVLKGLQLEGFRTSLPTGYFGIPNGYCYNMATAPLAAFMPFISIELIEPGGIFLGQNQVSKNFIFYDRRRSLAPNGLILGRPGRGKSVTAKWSIINALLTDPESEVIVLDPDREYLALAEAFGGQVVQLSGSSETHVNPFDLSLDREDGGLPTKVDAILSIVEEMCKGLTAIQQTLVDRTCTQIYETFSDTKDTKDLPTLVDFYRQLKAQPEPEGRVLATTIERYVSGQANMFAHHTNVDVHSRFIVYDIRDIPANLQGLGLLILLDATWQRIVRNREHGIRTWVFIDELQLILNNEFAVGYLDFLWSRARKYGALPTGITQNVERLLLIEKTRLMVSNTDLLILLGQSASDAEALGQILKLSARQIRTVRTAGVGEGLLIASGKIIPFVNQIPKDTSIYRVTTTKLEDIKDMARKA